ncbi:hypothetical protein [Undibacterium sp. WLHG33]|uniref:hypothetical protein n=1 Tax=Undibacterium sp. WLHG33 TaxID=3412482 RepID=UPI003C2CE55A
MSHPSARHLTSIASIISACIAATLFSVTVSAQTAAQLVQASNAYADMCKKSVNMPTGESDLKDNPKLDDYCKCFADKFLTRAIQSQPGASRTPLQETLKQEMEMRQSCRAKYNLPALKK